MRVAYADPPYIGQAKKLYGRYGGSEVDHAALIARLECDYSGWALSASSASLREILIVCPPEVRIAAWVRKAPKLCRGQRPTYAWEPVIFKPARTIAKGPVIYDWLCADPGFAPAGKAHIIGRKPQSFSFWLFDLLGAQSSDEFDDLFPGSGAVTRAWNQWRRMTPLAHPIERTIKQPRLLMAKAG